MKAEHGLYKGGTASDLISVKNREIGPAKRPCPGRQQPWARPRAGSASQQIQAGGTPRFALRRLRAPQPDPTPWTEPCSLLASLPNECAISNLISEVCSRADGQRALPTPHCSVLWNNDPHHQPAGSCRFTQTELVFELQPGH